MKFETVTYQGWQTCYRLSNDSIELIVTGDVGPRIIRFGFINGANVMKEEASQMGLTGGEDYRLYGGHRLWHAPEHPERTYQADNEPVDYFELDDVHYFVPPVEKNTGIQKQLSISFQENTVIIDHAITNQGMWSIELAPWAVTMLKTGGLAILPLPPHSAHDGNLLPTHALTLWSYTSLNDPRLYFSDRYIRVVQSTEHSNPLKIGLEVNPEYLWSVGWLAYINEGTMFAKSFHPPKEAKSYPDMGSQMEIFTNDGVLELETLGNLYTLAPEETITHREYWSLHGDVEMPRTDEEIGQKILPLIREAHPMVGRRFSE